MDELARRPKRVPHFAAMQMILTEMQNHAAAWPFVQPVNKEEVPDYYAVVQEPMDLSTMEQKLDSDQYTTPDEFVRDAKLIFNNCRAYNGETTTYYKVYLLQPLLWSPYSGIPTCFWRQVNCRMRIGWKSFLCRS